MKNIFKVVFLALVIPVYSCNTNIQGYEPALKKQDGSDMKINLNFKTSANPVGTTRVKSFEAFLTSNYNDPFASGDNPYGNNVRFYADVINGTANIVFPNVPNGGPYYAVLAAFDKLSSDNTKTNITREDNTITSTDKKWARSSNNFNNNNSVITYSDNGNALKVSLKLIPFVTINTEINITNGSPMPGTVGLTN